MAEESLLDRIQKKVRGVTDENVTTFDPDEEFKEFTPKEKKPDSYLELLNDKFSGAADFISKVPGILKDLPPAIRRAALGLEVGEDGVERPKQLAYDFPEMSDAPMGFFESFGEGNLRQLLTSDTNEKIEVMDKVFADDPRYGTADKRTAFSDGMGNALIFWKGKPYYVNKPGFSEIDFDSLLAQTLYFIPAVAQKDKKLISRLLTTGAKT